MARKAKLVRGDGNSSNWTVHKTKTKLLLSDVFYFQKLLFLFLFNSVNTKTTIPLRIHAKRLQRQEAQYFGDNEKTIRFSILKPRLAPNERKKRVSSKITNEQKKAWKDKGRTCKHLLKYLNPLTTPPTHWETISPVKISNIKTSKGAWYRRVSIHMFDMFVRLCTSETKWLT